MIWSDFHFYSESLSIQTAAYVLLPEQGVLAKHSHTPIPTLYLLHGLSDDYTMWLRNTRIAQYARNYYLAVVMPAVNRSFYTDMVHGAKYWTFVSDELPRVMEACFPLGTARDERFAAGVSMGGYGAMKLGLTLPERYAAVAALSAPMMLQDLYRESPHDPEMLQMMNEIFGSEAKMREGDGNLTRLADRLNPAEAPRLFAACGTEDFLYPANEEFIARYGEKFAIQYLREKGADHTWDFWDAEIQNALAWLPLKRLENVW